MKQEEIDDIYMYRCLQLAANGRQLAKPNPMVGAVIVSQDGRIIGEGYHVRCGEGHAEVNAFRSVRPEDEHLLPQATIYVSLEPCSHHGKTPPCADLIVRKGVRRVVCGCIDPFAEVQGRGIARIREAGIEVKVGVLEKECLALNRQFIVRNKQHRPYIILKWAQTDNGKIAYSPTRKPYTPLQISTPFTKMLVHKLRAESDAILVGNTTQMLENPQLNVREWSGNHPQKLVLSHTHTADDGITIHSLEEVVRLSENSDGSDKSDRSDNSAQPNKSHSHHTIPSRPITSLIVEGGAQTLESFIAQGLWDEIRIETAPFSIAEGIDAPELPKNAVLQSIAHYENTIKTYMRSE